MNGGNGTDTATYASRAATVTVDLDGDADDGEAGEGDNVAADVENVTGGGSGSGSAVPALVILDRGVTVDAKGNVRILLVCVGPGRCDGSSSVATAAKMRSARRLLAARSSSAVARSPIPPEAAARSG